MSIFRKVAIRLHRDRDFRELSKPQPNAQSIYLYLITAPSTIALPGVVPEGKAAIAEAFGWTVDEFETKFGELVVRGLAKADWNARLVFLPRVIHDNRPESPNVVKAWRSAFDELPDCDLKDEICTHMTAFLEDLHEAFQKAFDEDFAKGFVEGNATPSPNQKQNQKQKQKQKQEQKKEKTGSLPAFQPEAFDLFFKTYPRHVNRKAAAKAWDTLKPDTELQAKIFEQIDVQKKSAQWQDETFIPHPATWLRGERWNDRLPTGKPNGQPNGQPQIGEPGSLTHEMKKGLSRWKDYPDYETKEERAARADGHRPKQLEK